MLSKEWIKASERKPEDESAVLCLMETERDDKSIAAYYPCICLYTDDMSTLDEDSKLQKKPGFVQFDPDYGFYEANVVYWTPIPEYEV